MNSLDRKKRIRDAMAPFSSEQLEEIAFWRDQKVPLDKVAERCQEKFGIKISAPTLCRWDRERRIVEIKEDIQDLAQIAKDINQYAATGQCGSENSGFHTATLALIEKQAFELAHNQSDHDRLKDLF